MASAGAFYQVGTWTEGNLGDGSVLGQDGRPLTAAQRAEQYFGTANHAANIAGHALVGGAASVAGGGDFASGALSGGFGSAVTPLTILLNQQIPYTGLAPAEAAAKAATQAGLGHAPAHIAIAALFGHQTETRLHL